MTSADDAVDILHRRSRPMETSAKIKLATFGRNGAFHASDEAVLPGLASIADITERQGDFGSGPGGDLAAFIVNSNGGFETVVPKHPGDQGISRDLFLVI